MKNSYRFFQNKECEYFPCHPTSDPDKFSCLMCYCPLYTIDNCGGNCSYTEQGIKDCTNCLVPHNNYDYVLKKLGSINKSKIKK
jgi:Zn-finger protein